MLRQPGVDAGSEIPQRTNLTYYTRLSKDVVVLYAIEQFGETPEGVRLDGVQDGLRQLAGIHAAFDVVIRDVASEEDLPEGRDEVVDTLHVAARWVADGPDVEDALEGALSGFVAVKLKVRTCARDVDGDLMPESFIKTPDTCLVFS